MANKSSALVIKWAKMGEGIIVLTYSWCLVNLLPSGSAWFEWKTHGIVFCKEKMEEECSDRSWAVCGHARNSWNGFRSSSLLLIFGEENPLHGKKSSSFRVFSVSQIWAFSSWRFPEHPQWGEQMLWHLFRQVVWSRSSVFSCLSLCSPLTLRALGEKFSRWRYFRSCSVLEKSQLKMFCGYLCLTWPLGQVMEQQLFPWWTS